MRRQRPAAPPIPQVDRTLGTELLVASIVALTVVLLAGARLANRVPGLPIRRAVLIDELAMFEPHPAFVHDVGAVLGAAGYRLTYVPSADVTVERLQALPGDGARLIILRAHAARIVAAGRLTDAAALFSSEPVDLGRFDVSALRAIDASGLDDAGVPAEGSAPVGATRLSAEAADALVPVRRAVGTDMRPYLGLGARFVREQLRGRFRPDAVVVLMGCNTLRDQGLAQAFLDRGARAVIGWDGDVSAGHTDRATAALVAHLADHSSASDAVRAVALAVGPDPTSGANLVVAER